MKIIPAGTQASQYLPDVFNYTAVKMDAIKKFPKQRRTFRFVLYGALVSNGIVRFSDNGIAILDEDYRMVVADQLWKEPTGASGPSKQQIQAFEAILNWPWQEFTKHINCFPRTRQPIAEELPRVQ